MGDRMNEIEERVAQQADLDDEELPLAPDPNLKFWKDTAKGLLGESIQSIEETAKQIIGVAGILEGLYFHAIAYSDVRGKLGSGWLVLLYLTPLALWLGTTLDHRRYAEECVVMARRAEDDQDKMLWLTLAQSWVRLAEHVERSAAEAVLETQDE